MLFIVFNLVSLFVLVITIRSNLHGDLVRLLMNTSLVKNIVSLVILFSRYLDLGECDCRSVNISFEILLFENLSTTLQFLARCLVSLDVFLSFSRSQSTNKLQHGMHVIMINKQIDIDTNLIY